MVSHSIVIRPNTSTSATQTVSGNQELRCRFAVLTSVIVQMNKKFKENDEVTDAMVAADSSLTASADSGHNLYGVSIKFPCSVCPPGATHHSGSNNEHTVQNRIDVHMSQDLKSYQYKPNLILQGLTFMPDYFVTLYHIDNPDVPLTPTEVGKIHSITLNFSLTVSAALK